MVNIIKKTFEITEINKHKLFVIFCLQILTSFIMILKLDMINQLVNHVIAHKNDMVLMFALLVVAFFVLEILIEWIGIKYKNIVFYQTEIAIKKRYFNKIQNCYLADMDKKSKADIVTRFNDDIGNVVAFQVNTLSLYFVNVVKLLLIMIYIGYNNAFLLLFVFILPLMIKISNRYAKKSGEEYSLSNKNKSDMNVLAMNIVEHREDIRNMNTTSFFANKYKEKEEVYVRHEKKRSFYDTLVWFSGVAGYQSIYVLIYVIGGVLVYNYHLELGILVSMFTILDPMIDMVMSLPGIVSEIYKVKDNVIRLEEIMNLREKNKIGKDSSERWCKDNRIEYKNVKFKYDDKLVLDDVSLAFEIDEHIAIIGKSGSGKSTLLKLMMMYADSYEGNISVCGKDIKEISEQQMKEIVSFLPQEVFLRSDTIKDNILTVGLWDEERVKELAKIAEVEEEISKMSEGYNTLMVNGGDNISIGQRKRLSILMALNRNTKMLVMDETMSSIDKKTEIKITNNIFEKLKMGVITVTHRVSKEMLEKYDRIIVMDQGKVAAVGSYDEISDTQIFREIQKENLLM